MRQGSSELNDQKRKSTSVMSSINGLYALLEYLSPALEGRQAGVHCKGAATPKMLTRSDSQSSLSCGFRFCPCNELVPARQPACYGERHSAKQCSQPSGESDLNHSPANQNPAQASSNAMVEKRLSVELLRCNPDKIYVFGDNLLRRGTAGQAAIRSEPNAFGIPTKRAPSMAPSAFFSDQPDEVEAVLQALRELYVLARTKAVVFPAAGIGTGLARMATSSPEAYRQMCAILSAHFGFNQ